jgi:hypothetical protein
MDETQAGRELPKYRCHKEVHALKIKAIGPLFPPPCKHPYGQTTCGYGPNECMHIGTDSEVKPPAGRHKYLPGEDWPYGLTEAAIITPEDSGYAPFPVDAAYVRKHKPEVGGYYVVYKDGYKSFSPAEAFEEGYSRV